MTDFQLTQPSHFAGLDNFAAVLFDDKFWASFGRTFYFVLLVIGRRHQDVDVAPDDFGGWIPAEPLGAAIERLDPAFRIDHDNAVDGRIDDRLQPRAGVAQFG